MTGYTPAEWSADQLKFRRLLNKGDYQAAHDHGTEMWTKMRAGGATTTDRHHDWISGALVVLDAVTNAR